MRLGTQGGLLPLLLSLLVRPWRPKQAMAQALQLLFVVLLLMIRALLL